MCKNNNKKLSFEFIIKKEPIFLFNKKRTRDKHLSRFEQKNSDLTMIKVNEMLGFYKGFSLEKTRFFLLYINSTNHELRNYQNYVQQHSAR